MSVERDLISRVLAEQDLSAVVDAGITSKFFLNPEDREAFRWIQDHAAKYSVVPPVDTFKKDGPAYRLSEPKDATQYYLDQVIDRYTLALIEDGMYETTQHWEADSAEEAKKRLFALVSQLNEEIAGSRVTDLTETSAQRLERYRIYAKSDGGLKGISSGFEFIDDALGGYQGGQLITYVGPPKAGKSTILLLSLLAAHRGFYKPLFIGFEMSNEEQEERHDAIRSLVSHKKMREGTLSKEEWDKLERMTRRLEAMPPLIMSEDAASSLTLSGVQSQVDKYKPDIAFIDGVYMMDDEHGEPKGSPRALTNITRGFKQSAKLNRIPFIISTQVLEWKMDRKRGVTSNSIGYSSSFIQDSDAVIAVEKTDEPDVNKVKIVLARNSQGRECFVKWDWETGAFEELEDYDDGSGDEDESATKF